jgi:hypothetical protein
MIDDNMLSNQEASTTMIMELARFTVDPQSEQAFLAARPAMVEAVTRHVPGLESISLVRLADGSWLDVVTWTSREAAERGATLAAALHDAKVWLDHIDEDLSMDLGEIVDSAIAGLSRA